MWPAARIRQFFRKRIAVVEREKRNLIDSIFPSERTTQYTVSTLYEAAHVFSADEVWEKVWAVPLALIGSSAIFLCLNVYLDPIIHPKGPQGFNLILVSFLVALVGLYIWIAFCMWARWLGVPDHLQWLAAVVPIAIMLFGTPAFLPGGVYDRMLPPEIPKGIFAAAVSWLLVSSISSRLWGRFP
jgi:hypothetical protein